MTTPVWQPGTLYSPGAVVRRNSSPAPVASPPTNADFESGDTGWTKEAPWEIGTFDNKFTGSYSARCTGVKGTFRIYDASPAVAVPGLTIAASCQVRRANSGVKGQVQLEWLDSGMSSLRIDDGTLIDYSEDKWKESTVTGTAPAGTAYVRLGAKGILGNTDTNLHVDAFKWNYAYIPPIDALIFQAVQATAGYSGATEPTWPSVNGIQVVDNEVTWEAIDSSTVTWEASPILVSGTTEPVFPTEVGATVADNTIMWEAIARRVEDEKCPNGTAVVIAGSKIFCGDDDIVAFSATVNPLDWSTKDDAGYLPFGLQAYGSKPVSALGLYRSNLVAFNGISFQMWQVDPDPQNMAFLDAVPVGCDYPETLQSFQNDLLFQSPVGIRNISIAGASTNLQAGPFGKPVDALVREYMADSGVTPRSAFVPEYGQYWALFGDEAVVLTMLGVKKISWSRYVLTHVVTDSTVHEGALHVRADDGTVLRFTHDEVDDDVYCQPDAPVLSLTESEAYLSATLDWTAVTFDGGISEYVVLRARDGSVYSEVGRVDGDVLTYTDTGLLEDYTYSYAVVAVPAADGIDSERSNVESLHYDGIPAPILDGEIVVNDTSLTWTESLPASTTVVAYELYRSVDGGAYSLLTTTDEATFSYLDTTTVADTSYQYYVVAVGYDGRSSRPSNVVPLNFGSATPVLLATYTYNISAVSDAGNTATAIKSAGYHLDGAGIGGLLSGDTISVRVNTAGTYIAWSPWGKPALAGADTGSYWKVAVINGVDNSISYANSGATIVDGYTAARAQALAAEPFEFTGSTEYWFGIKDTPTSDNSGGCSITVEVWGVR